MCVCVCVCVCVWSTAGIVGKILWPTVPDHSDCGVKKNKETAGSHYGEETERPCRDKELGVTPR